MAGLIWTDFTEDYGTDVLELDGPTDEDLQALVDGIESVDDCW